MNIKSTINAIKSRQWRFFGFVTFITILLILATAVFILPILTFDPIAAQEKAAKQVAEIMKSALDVDKNIPNEEKDKKLAKYREQLQKFEAEGITSSVNVSMLFTARVRVLAAESRRIEPAPAAFVAQGYDIPYITVFAVPEYPRILVPWEIIIFSTGAIIVSISGILILFFQKQSLLRHR
jgi:hypothetical protein